MIKVSNYIKKIPRVVEIIGPAGAGKTSLYHALDKYEDRIWLSDFPDVRKLTNAPFFVRYGLQLVPTILRLHQRSSRQLSRREFAWMSILNGWPYVLQRDVKKSNKVIVLDQGPVYLLAEMREFGPEYLKSQDAEKFWQELFCRWADTLDMIVWLDTTDINLVERIRTRDQEHVVKNSSASIVFEFLARYRMAFEDVLSRLEANKSGPRVLRYDTSKLPSNEIAAALLAEFSST
jgi:hypothetical protein